MKVVLPNRPGVVEVAFSRSQSIAVGSTLAPATRAASDFAAAFGLPRRPGEVVPNDLPVVADQSCPGSIEDPAKSAVGCCGAFVDLNAVLGVSDQENLVVGRTERNLDGPPGRPEGSAPRWRPAP